MATTATEHAIGHTAPRRRTGLAAMLHDSWVVARRNLRRIGPARRRSLGKLECRGLARALDPA